MLTNLEKKKLDQPKKKFEHPKKKFEPVKNKIWSFQNFGLLKIEPKNCKKCYIHNIFTTNFK